MEKSILALIIAILFCTNVFAANGKTVVPLIQSSPSVETDIAITNITNHDLSVSVNVYCSDLNTPISNSYVTYIGFQNNNTEIGAKKIAQIRISQVMCAGPAVISWANKSTDNDLYGLIAAGQYWGTTSTWLTNFQINNAAPF